MHSAGKPLDFYSDCIMGNIHIHRYYTGKG